jgi:O-antigen ligase
MRLAVGSLLVLAPFHLVVVLTITNSIAMAYMVVLGLLLSGRRLEIPMLGSMLLVMLGYLISISQVHPSLYSLHGIALITLASNFLVFILAFNLAKSDPDPKFVVNLVLIGNVVVAIYCLVQLTAGPGNAYSLFGLEALTMEANRGEGDPRLQGPFSAPGIVAEYLALAALIAVYDSMRSGRSRRRWLWLLVAIDIGLIVATGNRGGFLTLIAGLLGLLYTFRKDIGTFKALQLAILAGCVLAFSSLLIIQFTDFNQMFTRLAGATETTGMIPTTRQVVWPQAWARFVEVPWFGQGPTWKLPMEEHGALYPGHVFFDYPHSLYLYLLVTIGIVGTALFLVFFGVLAAKYVKAARRTDYESDYVRGLARIGPLLLALFLLDQIRIEFLRPVFPDYQHVVFGLFGLWLGIGRRPPQPMPARAS